MRPLAPILTVTAFGMVWPWTKLRLDASGLVWPAGQMVKKLGALALVTVTLRTTAVAPAGTPPLPVTWTLRDCCPAHGELNWSGGPLGRESRMRTGLRAWK